MNSSDSSMMSSCNGLSGRPQTHQPKPCLGKRLNEAKNLPSTTPSGPAASAAGKAVCSVSTLHCPILHHQQQTLRMPQLSPQQQLRTPLPSERRSHPAKSMKWTCRRDALPPQQQLQQPVFCAPKGGLPALSAIRECGERQLLLPAPAAAWAQVHRKTHDALPPAVQAESPSSREGPLPKRAGTKSSSSSSPKAPADGAVYPPSPSSRWRSRDDLKLALNSSGEEEVAAAKDAAPATAASACSGASDQQQLPPEFVASPSCFEEGGARRHRQEGCCKRAEWEAQQQTSRGVATVNACGDRFAGEVGKALASAADATVSVAAPPSARSAIRVRSEEGEARRRLTTAESCSGEGGQSLCSSSPSPLLRRLSARLLTAFCCPFLPLGSLVAFSCSCQVLLQVAIKHKWVDKAVRRGTLQELAEECSCCRCLRRRKRAQREAGAAESTQGDSDTSEADIRCHAVRKAAAAFRRSSRSRSSSGICDTPVSRSRASPEASLSREVSSWRERLQGSPAADASPAAPRIQDQEEDVGCACKRQCLVRLKYWLLCRGRVELLSQRVAEELVEALKSASVSESAEETVQEQGGERARATVSNASEQAPAPPYTPVFRRPFYWCKELSLAVRAQASPSALAHASGDSGVSRRCWAHSSSRGFPCGSFLLPPLCYSVFDCLLEAALPESRADEIRRDVGRTFPTRSFFASASGQQKLYDVLHALACLDPHTGYCQGMNFMVGALLQLCDTNRVYAFWAFLVFHRAMDYRLLHEGGMPLLTTRTRQFDQIFKQHLPRLWNHLHCHWLSLSFFATQWLLASFSAFLNASLVGCVWDVFFASGWKALARSAVAVFSKLEPQLLQQTSLDSIIGAESIQPVSALVGICCGQWLPLK
ncbi:TBC domain-containing protein [Cyclospora cayetanensis]|uniref:TBC domain-containing protein n=1 Tax=Cyclospora cayetanensis TaxID=88456 RepID=A0A1D3CYL6_9EIME|nr:TBC domain-containing protein [Cyclospora cayetanensis]